MTHSDWGDWLLADIESASPTGIAAWYLGCNGFALKGPEGTVLFIDPYLGLGDPPRTVRMIPVPFSPEDVGAADAIFATHEHSDHVHAASQAPIMEQTGATFYGPSASVAVTTDEQWSELWEIEPEQFVTVETGDTLDIAEFTIQVLPANDPDAQEPVSYLVEYDGATFFHGGDTKPTSSFESVGAEYDIDVGALAFGSVGTIPDKETGEPSRTKWYSDENEIVEAARALELERLLPTHWDMWRGLTADPTVLHNHIHSFAYPRELEIARIGDRIDIE